MYLVTFAGTVSSSHSNFVPTSSSLGLYSLLTLGHLLRLTIMEESKLQAIADSLAKHKGRKGLGTHGGEYSWSKPATSTEEIERTDGLPNNALYSNFVKEGTYDPNKKSSINHGDGRTIKRDFSDIPAVVEDGSTDSANKKKETKMTKEQRKAAKKAAKLEAKKQAKLEEKRRLKKFAKMELNRVQESIKDNNDGEVSSKSKKRKRSQDQVGKEGGTTSKRKIGVVEQPLEETLKEQDGSHRPSKQSKKSKVAHADVPLTYETNTPPITSEPRPCKKSKKREKKIKKSKTKN